MVLFFFVVLSFKYLSRKISSSWILDLGFSLNFVSFFACGTCVEIHKLYIKALKAGKFEFDLIFMYFQASL